MSDPKTETDVPPGEVAAKIRAAAGAKMGDLWWVFFVRGVLALALGLAALFWPTSSISLLLRIAGLVLVLDGAMTFFGMRGQPGQEGASASGIGSAVIGAALLLLPSLSAKLVFVLLGIWALFTGAGHLMTWWKMSKNDPEREVSRNVGVMVLLIGIVLVFWPGSGLVGLGWIIAIVALLISALMFFLASRFKKLRALTSAEAGNP